MSPITDKMLDKWREHTVGMPKLAPIPRGFTEGRSRLLLIENYNFIYRGKEWTVPVGYTYDGASIPTLTGLTWVLTYSKFDPAVLRAALVHDYFCDERPLNVSSLEAALLFHSMLVIDGANRTKARMMFQAVKWFGPKWGDGIT